MPKSIPQYTVPILSQQAGVIAREWYSCLSAIANLVDEYLIAPVWDDVQFVISSGRVAASNAPTWEAFTTNTSEYSFAVNDYIDLGANEIPHSWKEGTDVYPHIHITTKAANATGANRFAKFTLYIASADVGSVWAETSTSAELTIPTGTAALTGFLLSFPAASFAAHKIGTQIKIRVKRIAATGGTEYSGNTFVTQCGIHIQKDTNGSRSISAK